MPNVLGPLLAVIIPYLYNHLCINSHSLRSDISKPINVPFPRILLIEPISLSMLPSSILRKVLQSYTNSSIFLF
jgi:hypothetical protein